MNISISLIIPVYNSEKHLKNLFASLANQTRPFDEIIFVDNNSKDNSFNLCMEFKDNFKKSKIIVLKEEKKGPSAARNTGLKKASSEILALTDADCELEKHWAENAVKYFAQDGQCEIIGGIAVGEEIFGRQNKFSSYTEEFSYYYWTLNRQTKKPYIMASPDDFFSDAPFTIATYNMAMKRIVFEKTKGFDERLLNNEDTEWWMRTCLLGFKSLVGMPDLKVCHHNRSELSSLYKQYYNYGEGLPYILKKFFKNRFLITFRSSKKLEFKGITGLIEINPHTLLYLCVIFNTIFLPLKVIPVWFILLFAARFILIFKYLSKIKTDNILKKTLIFSFIMEVRQFAWSYASLKGSVKYKTICVL